MERTIDTCYDIKVPYTHYAQQRKSDIKRVHTVWLFLHKVLRKGKTIPGGHTDWDGILENILGYGNTQYHNSDVGYMRISILQKYTSIICAFQWIFFIFLLVGILKK